MWKSGDAVVLRGIHNRRAWYVQSALVVQDNPEEVALVILPGAECAAPYGYIHGKHGPDQGWDRWSDMKKGWKLERYTWQTNRLLVLLEPDRYYASIYFWKHDIDQFLFYYVNFQLPFQRSKVGFDTLDLELDLIIEPSFNQRWKDSENYQYGIESGIILKEWTEKIDIAKCEVLDKITLHQYPFDGWWLNWRPDPNWAPPRLPEDWDKI
jgi:hypothetical protein